MGCQSRVRWVQGLWNLSILIEHITIQYNSLPWVWGIRRWRNSCFGVRNCASQLLQGPAADSSPGRWLFNSRCGKVFWSRPKYIQLCLPYHEHIQHTLLNQALGSSSVNNHYDALWSLHTLAHCVSQFTYIHLFVRFQLLYPVMVRIRRIFFHSWLQSDLWERVMQQCGHVRVRWC